MIIYEVVLLGKCLMREREINEKIWQASLNYEENRLAPWGNRTAWEDRTAVESGAQPQANVEAR